MKLTLVILICITLPACKSNKNSIKGETVPLNISNVLIKDTVVVAQSLPALISGNEFMEKEYYVTFGKDTSTFSCIVTEERIGGKIGLRWTFSMDKKISKLLSDSSLMLDTSSVTQPLIKKKPSYLIPSFENVINEFTLILKRISKEYNLHKVKFLKFDLSSFYYTTFNITQLYIAKFGNDGFVNSSKMKDFLKEGSFINVLERIFSSYSITIKKIDVDGLAFIDIADVHDSEHNKGLKRILAGTVVLSLERK